MNKVTVYTTSTCPYCTMLMNFLKEKQITFKEVNVEKNQAEMQRVVNKTGQMGVPQTEINGKWVLGFDPNKILASLK